MRRLIAAVCLAGALLSGVNSSLPAAPYAGAWVWLPHVPLSDAHVVYDGTGDRMLALKDGVLYQLPLGSTPIWSVVPTTGAPPSNANSIALDTVRNRILVFSGAVPPSLWALPLASPTWTDITPPGAGPSQRDAANCLYDAVRDQLLIYGGRYGSGSSISGRSDTWQVPFAGAPSWSAISASGTTPPGRYSCGQVYDPVRDRMVIYAGRPDGSFVTDDLWALTLTGTPTWSRIIPSGTIPFGRGEPIIVYDPSGDRLVMTGGSSGDRRSWTFPLAGAPAWSQIPTTSAPETNGAGIYDPVRQRLLMHGAKTWGLTLTGPAVWSGPMLGEIEPAKSLSNYASSFDSKRDLMIVQAQQTWSLKLGEVPLWTQLSTFNATDQVQIYDPVGDQTLVFGAVINGSTNNQVWQLPGGTSTWTQLSPEGTPPSDRNHSAGIYDPLGDCMMIFGGTTAGAQLLDDVWELRLAGIPTWYRVIPVGTPPPARKNHVAVYDSYRRRMLIFGGQTSTAGLNDVWALNLAEDPMTWEQLTPSGAPPSARINPAGVYLPGQDALIIYGGTGGFGDTWRLSLSPGLTWTELAPTGIPASVQAQVTGIFDYDHNRMVVYSNGFYYSRAWSLDWTGVTTGVDPPNAAPRTLTVAAAASLVDHGRDLVARIELPVGAPASLRVYDIAGRVVALRDLIGLAPGPHEISLAEVARHPAGVYLMRLDQAGQVAHAKAVLLR